MKIYYNITQYYEDNPSDIPHSFYGIRGGYVYHTNSCIESIREFKSFYCYISIRGNENIWIENIVVIVISVENN